MTAEPSGDLVFLGPTCPVAEARAVLPGAIFLPPVKCGDILQGLRLRPSRIAIIDGVFREVAAVWHKEILHALDAGVEVWGASSMGALRAAELSAHGMQGFGAIFRDYLEGRLIDDDEVALLIRQEGPAYFKVTDALVDIRATLALAVDQAVIGADDAAALLTEIKGRPYQERHLRSCLERRQDRAAEVLIRWLDAGHQVDQKREDALGLLQHLAANPAQRPSQPQTPPTLALRRLTLSVMTAPLDFPAEVLPEEERQLQRWARRPLFPLLRRLAYFLAMFDGLAPGLENSPAPSGGGRFSAGLACTPDDPALRDLVDRIDACLGEPPRPQKDAGPTGQLYGLKAVDLYAGFLADCTGDISRLKEVSPLAYRIGYLLALLEEYHQAHLSRLGYRPRPDRVRERTLLFRRMNGLDDPTATAAWMARNDLDIEGMENLMERESNYQTLVAGAAFDHLGFLEPTHRRCWLLDAVALVEGPA